MKHILLIAAFVTFTVTACNFLQEDTSGLVELVEKAVANKSEWQGKEVSVYGYISIYNPPPKGTNTLLHLRPSRTSEIERHVHCMLPDGNQIGGIEDQYVTVKGTIAKIASTNYLNQKLIVLEPCELVQTK